MPSPSRKCPEDITIDDAVKAIGRPTASWEGDCFGVATQVVEAGLVEGTAVYGHYLGEVHHGSIFAGVSRAGFVQHGWVVLSDGRVFDPTRWAFESRKPYLFLSANTQDYDEGGNGLRHLLRVPVPALDPAEKLVPFPEGALSLTAYAHLEKLMGFAPNAQGRRYTRFQIHWLATAPSDSFQPHAVALYKAIAGIPHMVGFIPIDNRRRAEREAQRAS